MSFLNPPLKTFNLLSIGQRGVGKTVFMAGSFAELHHSATDQSSTLWFDCQDSSSQLNINKILSYLESTGRYPPATMKVTNFGFSLKRRHFWGTRTLCNFRWQDIPGETCSSDNADFRETVLGSHGCCVFIDADALSRDTEYLSGLKEVVNQVLVIASLASLNKLPYSFAVVLTKCDRLEHTSDSLKERLQPVVEQLENLGANFRVFHSSMPLVQETNGARLQATGGAAAILWLVWELSKAYSGFGLLEWVTQVLPARFHPSPASPAGVLQELLSQVNKVSEANQSR